MKKVVIICCLAILIFSVTISALALRDSSTDLSGFSPEIQSYIITTKENNETLSDLNISDINATITFASPLNAQDIDDYIKTHNLNAIEVQGRCINNEERITFAASLSNSSLDTVVRNCERINGDFVGFVSLKCQIDSEQINDITNDEKTFLLDTGNTLDVYMSPNAIENSELGNSSKFPNDIAWELEDALSQK